MGFPSLSFLLAVVVVVVLTPHSAQSLEEAVGAPREAKLRFLSMGCWGGEKAHRRRQKVLGDRIATFQLRWDLQFAIAAGDNFYRRGVKSVDDPRWAETFENVYPSSLPFYAALGNHDYKGNIWAQVNRTAVSPRWFLPFPYYTLVAPLNGGSVVTYRDLPDGRYEGSLVAVVIDTVLLERCFVNMRGTKLWADRCWDGNSQVDWLTRQLQHAGSADWRVLVGHYPVMANGPHVNQQWLRDLIVPLSDKYGVAAYINADNHYMQYSVRNGTYYLNAGGGAGYMLHSPRDKGFSRVPESQWEHMGDGVFVHFVTTSVMSVWAVDPLHGVLHRFSIPPKHPEGRPNPTPLPQRPPTPHPVVIDRTGAAGGTPHPVSREMFWGVPVVLGLLLAYLTWDRFVATRRGRPHHHRSKV